MQARPAHPARRFIDPSNGEGTKSNNFSDSLRQMGDVFSSAERNFSRSLESFTSLFAQDGADSVSVPTKHTQDMDAFVPEIAGTHRTVQKQIAPMEQSFRSYGGSMKQGQPANNGRVKSWEEGQKNLKKLRQQLHEQKPQSHKVAARSVLKETAEIQKQMQSRDVQEALEQRQIDSMARSKQMAQRNQHKEGLTFHVKLGPLKGTKTYHKVGQLALEELGG